MIGYKIVHRLRGYNAWKDERFLTGGKTFEKYSDAQKIKKKLQKMNSSIIYKVVKK